MAAFLTEVDFLHRLGGASPMEECHLKEPKAETLIRIRSFRRVLRYRLYPPWPDAVPHRERRSHL